MENIYVNQYRNFILAIFTISSLVLALNIFSEIVHAHGTGITWSEHAGEYYIDVDYSDERIEAGTTGRFTFNIFADEERTERTPFTNLWVRIESEGEKELLFAGPIGNPEFGGVGFSFSFPESGAYTLYVRYHDGEATLTEASFPVIVESGRGKGAALDPQLIFGFIAGLCLAGVFLFWRSGKK